MARREEPYYTPDEYLERERAAESKSKYFDGRVYAMTGASRNHERIVSNLLRDFGTRLRGRTCEAFGSSMRVRVSDTGLYTYPNVSVVCGEGRFDDSTTDTLLNPVLLVEVLSKTTEAYDRGTKFSHYQKIPSLRTYVLFAQDAVHAERFERDGEQWVLTTFDGSEAVVDLPSIGCALRLAEVYERVDLQPQPLRAVHDPAACYAAASA
jgi:Uma2 family endonuclease